MADVRIGHNIICALSFQIYSKRYLITKKSFSIKPTDLATPLHFYEFESADQR
jgi:hypothetical protein